MRWTSRSGRAARNKDAESLRQSLAARLEREHERPAEAVLPDLSHYSREDLNAAAAELNSRPRKTLDWETPAERLSKLLATTRQ